MCKGSTNKWYVGEPVYLNSNEYGGFYDNI